ncbi:hypothetical protein KC19_2G073300 [Ceratodon purpureus]|uniref:Uncharacterized protein n=1 Tax=Ceratodon purpureus TaxID=3225 RepID=A0A8T0IU03_CERPU|nr:hypothetical protein KC19_2G073300 [Ceratodon purpureus]
MRHGAWGPLGWVVFQKNCVSRKSLSATERGSLPNLTESTMGGGGDGHHRGHFGGSDGHHRGILIFGSGDRHHRRHFGGGDGHHFGILIFGVVTSPPGAFWRW